MPRAERSAAGLEAMRERILGAAADLLREGGMPAFTIRALAERLAMSPMGLYVSTGSS